MSNLMKRDDSLKRALAMLFTCVGVAIMLASAAWAASVWRFTTRASSAKGVVTQLNAGGSHPQVKFVTHEGQVMDYPQNGLIFGFRVGDEVRVLYDRQHPADAVIDTFGALWGFPALAFIMGAGFVGMGQLARRRPDLIN